MTQVLPRLKSIFDGSCEDSWRLNQYEKGGDNRLKMRLDCVLKHPFSDHQEEWVKTEITVSKIVYDGLPNYDEAMEYIKE